MEGDISNASRHHFEKLHVEVSSDEESCEEVRAEPRSQ